MSNRLKGWLILALLVSTAVYALAEEITLTTYYPSPRGVYQELKTVSNASFATDGGSVTIGATSATPGVKLAVESGITVGNAPETGIAAGTIRWNGTELQVFNGTEWVGAIGAGGGEFGGLYHTYNFGACIAGNPFLPIYSGVDSYPVNQAECGCPPGFTDKRVQHGDSIDVALHLCFKPPY